MTWNSTLINRQRKSGQRDIGQHRQVGHRGLGAFNNVNQCIQYYSQETAVLSPEVMKWKIVYCLLHYLV